MIGPGGNGAGEHTDHPPDRDRDAATRPDDAEAGRARERDVEALPEAQRPREARGPERQSKAERQHDAEGRLRDALARERRAELGAIQQLRYGCIGVIVLLVLLLVIGFVFF